MLLCSIFTFNAYSCLSCTIAKSSGAAQVRKQLWMVDIFIRNATGKEEASAAIYTQHKHILVAHAQCSHWHPFHLLLCGAVFFRNLCLDFDFAFPITYPHRQKIWQSHSKLWNCCLTFCPTALTPRQVQLGSSCSRKWYTTAWLPSQYANHMPPCTKGKHALRFTRLTPYTSSNVP